MLVLKSVDAWIYFVKYPLNILIQLSRYINFAAPINVPSLKYRVRDSHLPTLPYLTLQ